MNNNKDMSRRSFLRAAGIGVIAGSASMIWFEAYLAGECFGNGKCKKCPAFKGCDLPLKAEYEAQHPTHPRQQPQDMQEPSADAPQEDQV